MRRAAAVQPGINQQSLKQKLKSYRHQPLSLILLILTLLSAVLTVGVLVCLIGYILIKGIPNITPQLFEWHYTTKNVSMMPAIINTLLMTLSTLIIAVPIGIGSAIYLVEYAKRGNKLVKVVRMTTETLQGIPSIVFGLFGFLLFVITCGMGYSLLGGALTLAIMVLPLIMRTTEEALLSVPDAFREGSFGLGAGRLRTIFRIVLPSAMPGILSGVILAIGRIVGETAALMFTAGTASTVATSPLASCRTLAVHMYVLLNEGLYMNQANTMAKVIYDALDEKKGADIKIIDISTVSTIADYFVIATGNSNSQVSALVENVEEQMHKNGFAMKQREGNGNSPWILLDYADVIVHVFDKENRSFYNLEHIWHDGKEIMRDDL